jgi:hypothetical protein
LPIADRKYYRKEVSDHLKSLKFQDEASHQNATQSEFETIKSILQTFKHQNSLPYQQQLQHLLIHNTYNQDKFTQSGVYKLTCPDCGKAYLGQTGKDFKTRFN